MGRSHRRQGDPQAAPVPWARLWPYVQFQGIQVPFSRERAPHLATVFPQIDNAARIDSGVLDAIDEAVTALFGVKEVMAALKKGPNNGLYEVSLDAESLQVGVVAQR